MIGEFIMKLRVINHRNEKYILCPNGSKIKVTQESLSKLLINFKKPSSFKGEDGYWSEVIADMNSAPGETLAFVDDKLRLIILNNKLFEIINVEAPIYISATEYADKQGKSRPAVKNMCAAGRIEGAYKTSSGWLIPENAPWPERKERTIKK